MPASPGILKRTKSRRHQIPTIQTAACADLPPDLLNRCQSRRTWLLSGAGQTGAFGLLGSDGAEEVANRDRLAVQKALHGVAAEALEARAGFTARPERWW